MNSINEDGPWDLFDRFIGVILNVLFGIGAVCFVLFFWMIFG